MPDAQIVRSYILALFLVNAFVLLTFSGIESDLSSAQASDNWSLPEFPAQTETNIKDLLKSGLWGQLSNTVDATEMTDPEKIAEQEAKRIRTQVKAIINTANNKHVIFMVGTQYHRVAIGDELPETGLILQDVGEDWLILSRRGSETETERFELFSRQQN